MHYLVNLSIFITNNAIQNLGAVDPLSNRASGGTITIMSPFLDCRRTPPSHWSIENSKGCSWSILFPVLQSAD